MASTFRADIAGIRAALRSKPVRAEVEKAARRIAGAANGMAPKHHGYTGPRPYGCYVDDGAYTVVGKVVAQTEMARRDNAKNQTLLKALGGAR
ncbi:MAG: hypothetical protein K5859_05995 [Atopobiaceae bacterium]|nr:hypothetical protein [Atopobiaceae bacterium]